MADQVMGMRGSNSGSSSAIARQAGVGNALGNAPPSVNETLSAPGQPLDAASRSLLEPRFGADFSQVRIHADDRAAESARAVHANAYTVGQHVVFGNSQFEPRTPAGQHRIAHELAHVVQQAGQPPVIQRQAASNSGDEPRTRKESKLVRVERYRGSTSARAFFADGSHEEVTFVDTKGLDGDTSPTGTIENIVSLTIDRSSLIRPRLERAGRASGSKVMVATRSSPTDRISRLPANVRGEVSQAFLGDPDYQPDPATMEFAADMGERLNEASDTMRIAMEGRDPATVTTLRTVDQWVSEQQGTLDKVGTLHRARFTHLLSDIHQIGVTGRSADEDLDAQDVELVLAGAAGGQSEFQTFDEFKRRKKFDLRSGRASVPAEHAHNPDFFVRCEYRKAWKAEAAALRRMSRIAEAAQAAPFVALGFSAAAGTGLLGLELGAAGLAARGVPYALQAKWVGASFFASGLLGNYLAARDEAKAAGMDPNSPLGVGGTFSAAFLRTTGLGTVTENVTNKSILTNESLNRSASERIVGGGLGLLDTFSFAYSLGPKTPGKLPDAPDSSAAKAGTKGTEASVGPAPPATTQLPDPPAPVAQAAKGRTSQSAELDMPGPHPFFKNGAANQNMALPPAEAQVAKIPLAKTGTGDPVSAHIVDNTAAKTGPGAAGTTMSGPPKPATTPAPKAQTPKLSVSDVRHDIGTALEDLNSSKLPKPMTRKKLVDLQKEADALAKAESKGTNVSEKLKDIQRRYEETYGAVEGEVANINISKVPPPAPMPPKPGEFRNPAIPTATKPSGSFRWIEDNPEMSDQARAYEHGAAGARSRIASRSGEVPALDWVRPGGEHARVKFDGLDELVFVDRKTAMYRQSAPEQALRQSEALRQNGYTGRWEVPNVTEKKAVETMFANLGITNIEVKVVPIK